MFSSLLLDDLVCCLNVNMRASYFNTMHCTYSGLNVYIDQKPLYLQTASQCLLVRAESGIKTTKGKRPIFELIPETVQSIFVMQFCILRPKIMLVLQSLNRIS